MKKNSSSFIKIAFKRILLISFCLIMTLAVCACKIAPTWLKVSTYNVWKCCDYPTYLETKQLDANADKIVDFVLDENIDVIALQEVDVNRITLSAPDSGPEKDQPKYITDCLTDKSGENYYYCFAPTLVRQAADTEYKNPYGYPTGTGLYGIAVISRFPIVDYRVVYLAFHDGYDEENEKTFVMNGYERRALLIVDIMVERQVVTVINTHFDLDVESRAKSIKVLERELENIDNPVIFMGDLNMTEREDSLTYIAENLLTPVSDIREPQFSFPSNKPNRQIDWIFVSEDIGYKDFKVINSSLSDHCPLSVLVNIPEE